MNILIEDYKRRLKTMEEMISNFNSNGSINDIRKDERLKTKASQYRTFISELEKARLQNKEDVFDTLINFAPNLDAKKVQKHILEKF